jgi:GH24 family phage-related lysozyme (muramidase)
MIKLKSILLEQAVNSKLANVIKGFENNKNYKPGGWDPIKKRWFQHPSPEGGNPTIAYGHKLTDSEVATNRFVNGLTDAEANALLQHDMRDAEAKAKRLVKSYDTLPIETKQALINACYRGELGTEKTPATLKLMNAGKWEAAAREYLNHEEYKSADIDSTVKRRMDWNASRFGKVSKIKEPVKSTEADNMVGKLLYPRLTPEYDYATVRTSPMVNTGIINNEQTKIYWPESIGAVIATKQVDDKTWYQVKLPKNVGNGTGLGWVRSDVVTTDKNAKYE